MKEIEGILTRVNAAVFSFEIEVKSRDLGNLKLLNTSLYRSGTDIQGEDAVKYYVQTGRHLRFKIDSKNRVVGVKEVKSGKNLAEH